MSFPCGYLLPTGPCGSLDCCCSRPLRDFKGYAIDAPCDPRCVLHCDPAHAEPEEAYEEDGGRPAVSER